MQENISPAVTHLRLHAIPFQLFQHSGPIHSLEQAAEERGQLPAQVIRSIVFRLDEGSFLMVLMAGPGQVPWKALRRRLGQSRLTMATEEELYQATGYRPGTVTPFGLPHPMPILIDTAVLTQPQISLGSGQRGLAILMTPDDLLRGLDTYEVVDFAGADSNSIPPQAD
jgi:Cys-tRNA(Pro) deacylase